MKRVLPIIISVILYSCSQFDGLQPSNESVSVSFVVKGTSQDKFTSKATERVSETLLDDVNIFLFNDNSSHKYQIYSANPTINLKIIPGQYTIAVIVNYGSDLGNMSLDDLQNRIITSTQADNIITSGKILMSTIKHLTITPTSNNISIEVYRNLAKVNFSVACDESTGIVLNSIQFFNMPLNETLFETNEQSSKNTADYKTSSINDLLGTPSYITSFYMMENKQGTISKITTQQQKSITNAPQCATYAYITAHRAASPSDILEYYVYLGENSTSDFNIRRNTIHTIEASIKGTNTIDTRIKTTTLTHAPIQNYAYYGQNINGSIDITSSGLKKFIGILKFDGAYEGLTLKFNNKPYYPSTEVDITSLDNVNYSITYAPSSLTPDNYILRHRLTVVDEMHNKRDFPSETQYMYTLKLTTTEGSSITPPAGYKHFANGMYYYVPTLDNQHTVTATLTNPAFKFAGWVDENGNNVSSNMAYKFQFKDKNISLTAVSASDLKVSSTPLTTSIAVIRNNATITVSEVGYTGDISVRAKMLSGSGLLKSKDALLSDTPTVLPMGSFPLDFIPTSIGTSSFKITITDKYNQTRDVNYTVVVSPNIVKLTTTWASADQQNPFVEGVYTGYWYNFGYSAACKMELDAPLEVPISVEYDFTVYYALQTTLISPTGEGVANTYNNIITMPVGEKNTGFIVLHMYPASAKIGTNPSNPRDRRIFQSGTFLYGGIITRKTTESLNGSVRFETKTNIIGFSRGR